MLQIDGFIHPLPGIQPDWDNFILILSFIVFSPCTSKGQSLNSVADQMK